MYRQTAIIGVGEATDFGKVPGRTSLRLNAEAAVAAIDDAGLTKQDIDGVLTGYTLTESHFMFATVLCEYLRMAPKYHSTLVVGGATPCTMVEHAATAVLAGLCNYCLVVYGDSRGSGYSLSRGVASMADIRDHPEHELPWGLPPAGPEALMARRHMYEYGTTSEDLASAAVAMRKHAALNPKALRRTPLTVEEVLASPMVSDPLHALDCCLLSNFGGAVIVTTAERAKKSRKAPVYLLGVGEGFSHKYISQAASLTQFPVRDAADRAFSMAGVGPDDIDVAGVYDGFTITLLLNLEDLGFCKKGESGRFIADGAIGLEGKIPVNTHGGMLSCAHGGILHLTEVVNQLRGECGDRSVPDAHLGLVHGDGASQSTHTVLILGTT
jgi:acetyl-CoA acetyltransferase